MEEQHPVGFDLMTFGPSNKNDMGQGKCDRFILRCTSTLPGLRAWNPALILCVLFSDVSFNFKVCRRHHHHHHHPHHPHPTFFKQLPLPEKSRRNPLSSLPSSKLPAELPVATRSESRARSIRSTSGDPSTELGSFTKKWWKVELRSFWRSCTFFGLHLKKNSGDEFEDVVWRFITSFCCSCFGLGSGCMLLFRW